MRGGSAGIGQQLPEPEVQAYFMRSRGTEAAALLEHPRVRDHGLRIAGDVDDTAALERDVVGHA